MSHVDSDTISCLENLAKSFMDKAAEAQDPATMWSAAGAALGITAAINVMREGCGRLR